VIERREVGLTDPEVPWSRQPFHAGLELDGAEAERVVTGACEAVRQAALRALGELERELRSAGRAPCCAGIVASGAEPDRIANPHVRAHASEGRLFREATEAAVAAVPLQWLTLVEKEAWDQGSLVLRTPTADLKQRLGELGRSVGPPWRMDEKLATLAARVALTTFPDAS
jgi:hypothetical protein